MAQIHDQELPPREVHRRLRRRRRTLGESMPAPVLIHRPTADELKVHGAGASYFEALAVLKRALEDSALLAALRRVLGWGRAQTASDQEVIERLAREVAGGRMIIYGRAPPAKPADTRYAAAYDKDYRALLAGPFVGVIPHMRLDGRGRVIVGAGSALPTPAAALLARFVHRTGRKVATPTEVSAAYMNVRGSIANRPAQDYRILTDLDLAPGEAERLLGQDLERTETGCAGMFGGWSHFPQPARLALLDMAYDLGEDFAASPAERQAGRREQGLHPYAGLREAVAKEDWAAASSACHRENVPRVRDVWTRDKFIKAAHLAPPRPDPHRALRL
ncbi:MAG: hypothetical protein WDM85_02410 [Caulobacteraceae bacterium]